MTLTAIGARTKLDESNPIDSENAAVVRSQVNLGVAVFRVYKSIRARVARAFSRNIAILTAASCLAGAYRILEQDKLDSTRGREGAGERRRGTKTYSC